MRNYSNVAKKWQTNLSAATTSMTQGAQAVTEAPGIKAAAAVDRYQAGVQQAVADGTYAARVSAVSLPAWQQAFIKKGVPRVAQGAAESLPKMESFVAFAAPTWERTRSETAAMAQGGGEAARARMNRNFDIMSGMKYRRR